MDKDDFKELIAMKRRGEPNEKVLEVFKVLGYSREDTIDAIAEAQVAMVQKPETEEPEDREKLLHILKLQKFHPAAPLAVLIFCVVALSLGAIILWVSNSPPIQVQQRMLLGVNPVSCSESGAVLMAENFGSATIPASTLSTEAGKCVLAHALLPRGSAEIYCEGGFPDGEYTLVGEGMLPATFRCPP